MGKVLTIKKTGDFKRTNTFLSNIVSSYYMHKLRKYAERGVEALREATPKDSGATADAWTYEIVESPGRTAVYWRNERMVDGVNIAILLEYGHGTRNGGFVEGRHFIGDAIKPIFDKMADEIWKEVVQ